MAGERIIQTIKKASVLPESESAGLVFGQVIKVNPMVIRVDNRYEITNRFILLSSLCKPKSITVGGEVIQLWRGLQVGDTVRMIRVAKGQLFYVVEREEGLT